MESQDKALIIVQRLLRKQGIRARRDHTISLGLFANRLDTGQLPSKPPIRSWKILLPPELVVIDSAGQRQATVTMGPRAEDYAVSLPVDPAPRTVSRAQPEQVAALIVGAMSQGAA